MARLHEHYRESVVPELTKKFGYTSAMQVPRITKITVNSSLLTPQQTETGQFYLENPGRQVNRWIRDIAGAQGLSVVDSARFFAHFYVAVADAAIACFDSKNYYNFWRPVTEIRAGDTDGNDATEADPAWTPLATTPPHQEYPGAHSCVTGTLSYVLEDFFGTKKLAFSLTSRSVPGVPLAVHDFARPQDLRQAIIDARINGGMHYRTSAVHGMVIANKVARWVSKSGRLIDLPGTYGELGQLALLFNRRTCQLLDVQQELRQAQDGLEARVEERTEALRQEMQRRQQVRQLRDLQIERAERQHAAVLKLSLHEALWQGDIATAAKTINEIAAEVLGVCAGEHLVGR